MMRNMLRKGFVVLTMVGALLYGPALYASNQEWDEIYYNSSGCWQGERFVSCIQNVTITGSLTGAHWKLIHTEDCETQHVNRHDWYVWDGSAWVPTSDPGLPGC